MSQGKIVQCIGAVVDVEFAREELPKVYDALVLEGTELTLEVQQQLGSAWCARLRCVVEDSQWMMVTNTREQIKVLSAPRHAGSWTFSQAYRRNG